MVIIVNVFLKDFDEKLHIASWKPKHSFRVFNC